MELNKANRFFINEQLIVYPLYHDNLRNKYTHFRCPLFFVSTFDDIYSYSQQPIFTSNIDF